MSCNGCRVLRKGCGESCILRPCLQAFGTPEAQGHATVFVAKFFGRAGLMSFISAVPEPQRPALFRSLLFEACGRTINPVNGAVGLLVTGNWHLCQAAMETVLRGGSLRPLTEITGADAAEGELDGGNIYAPSFSAAKRRKTPLAGDFPAAPPCDLDLCLAGASAGEEKRRPETPSMNSEESGITIADIVPDRHAGLLNLFV